MEGLIPFIYKAIKERRSRGYSRCASARGFAAGDGGVDGDVWEQKHWPARGAADGRAAWRAGGGGGRFPAEREMAHHRRHRSLEELAGEVGASPEWRAAGGGLARGRSARIFSCISGV